MAKKVVPNNPEDRLPTRATVTMKIVYDNGEKLKSTVGGLNPKVAKELVEIMQKHRLSRISKDVTR